MTSWSPFPRWSRQQRCCSTRSAMRSVSLRWASSRTTASCGSPTGEPPGEPKSTHGPNTASKSSTKAAIAVCGVPGLDPSAQLSVGPAASQWNGLAVGAEPTRPASRSRDVAQRTGWPDAQHVPLAVAQPGGPLTDAGRRIVALDRAIRGVTESGQPLRAALTVRLGSIVSDGEVVRLDERNLSLLFNLRGVGGDPWWIMETALG
jgi:hypothetical protein